MADEYLMKVNIDFDNAEFDKLSGKISDQLSSMGKVSDEFIDAALEKAKEYKSIIEQQEKIVANIDKQLGKAGLSDASRKVLEDTKAKSLQTIKDYTDGNAEKNLDSKWVVDSMAEYAAANKSYATANKSFASKLNETGSAAIMGISKLATSFGVAKLAISGFVKEVGEALKKFSDFANKFNPLGAFGSQSQRDIMTRYGMTGSQALGFKSTLDALKMSEQDVGKMTSEQRRVFESLQNFWNEGIAKLNPDALDRYTKSMDELQEIQAKFDMGLQQTILKLITSSPKFNEFVGSVGDLLESTLEFFQSPVVQAVFDGLIDFLTTVVTILERAMFYAGKLLGSNALSGGTTNNTTNNVNSNFNIYGNDFKSNEELARQISYSTKGNYGG